MGTTIHGNVEKSVNLEKGDYIEDNSKTIINHTISNFYQTKIDNYYTFIQSIYNELDNVEIKDRAKYEAQIATWLPNWTRLHEDSKTFLVSGEYLYENPLADMEDYSPFVLQYCRVMENELKQRCFVEFQKYFAQIPLQDKSLMEQELIQKYPKSESRFRNFYNFANGKENKYTQLDNMIQSIKATISSNTCTLKFFVEYYKYLSTILDTSKIITTNANQNGYLDLLDKMRDKYRNNAAHPEILTKQDADDCKKLMQETIFPIWVNSLQ